MKYKFYKTKLNQFFINNENNKICQICGKKYKSFKSIGNHLKSHKISKNEYYDKFLKKDNEGICIGCGNQTNFISLTKGYYNYCSRKCCENNIIIIINKSNKTKKERYGENYFKDYMVVKSRQTKKDRYGDENYNNEEKRQETCIERYGANSPLESEIILEKIKNTMIEKYGVDNIQKNKEIKEITIKTFKENRRIERENDKTLPIYKKYRLDVMCETYLWIDKLWDNWNGRCYYCGEEINKNVNYNNPEYPTIDHKISIYYGFKHNIDPKIIGHINNLGICCRSFNSIKSAQTLTEYSLNVANKILELFNKEGKL